MRCVFPLGYAGRNAERERRRQSNGDDGNHRGRATAAEALRIAQARERHAAVRGRGGDSESHHQRGRVGHQGALARLLLRGALAWKCCQQARKMHLQKVNTITPL